MKVVYLNRPETVEIRDVPVRCEAGAGEVLVQPRCVGLSGHEGLRYKKGPDVRDGFLPPHVPGSEFVADVVAVGRGVGPNLRGRRIVANPISPCFKCEWCVEGHHNLCPNVRILGEAPVAGALQQRLTWPASLCTVVPSKIPDHVAVLLVQLANAIHIIDMAQLRPMESCAVLGCGHLGLLLIKALRASGAGRIMGVEMHEYRRKAALAHGADVAVTPVQAIELVKMWKRSGVDVAIDVSNAAEACRLAVELVRIGGRAMMAASPRDNRVLFNAYEARLKQVTLQFVRRPHDTFARAAEMMASGRLGDLESIITHKFELEDIDTAFRTVVQMRDELIKAVVQMPAYSPREESPQAIWDAREREAQATT